jgi:hypothetical protein
VAKPNTIKDPSLEAFTPPKILREPQSRQIPLSGKVAIRISATGNPLPSFQWFHNGKKIAGATNDMLVLNHLRRDQGGAYTCEVKNIAGKAMSRSAMISFLPEKLPELIVEPAEAKIPVGRSFEFKIVSPDPHTLKEFRLQWTFNGKKIRGAMGTKLEFLQIKKKYEGEYKVRIVLDDQILTSNCVKLIAVADDSKEEVKSALEELTREIVVKKEPIFFDPNEFEQEEEKPAVALVPMPENVAKELEVGSLLDLPLTDDSQISLTALPPLPAIEREEVSPTESTGLPSPVLDLSKERKRLFLEKFLWHWQGKFQKSAEKKVA